MARLFLDYYRDYQSIPRLDTYDAEHLDKGEYDTIEPAARAAAEKTMRKRDRQVRMGLCPALYIDKYPSSTSTYILSCGGSSVS